MDMALSKLWEIVKDTGAWHATVDGDFHKEFLSFFHKELDTT